MEIEINRENKYDHKKRERKKIKQDLALYLFSARGFSSRELLVDLI